MEFYHEPIMLEKVIEFLEPRPGGIYVDCTIGGAGHSREIVKKILPDGLLIGIDQDLDAIRASEKNLEQYKENVKLIHDNFKNIKFILGNLGIFSVNGILMDLGVSSYQLDEGERGFSYNKEALLDMRMDKTKKLTAEDLVNNLSEEELKEIIKEYGEERWAGRIARFIVKEREKKRIKTTLELVEIIKKAIPAPARREGPHPAKRTFQALRIAVNNELEILESAVCDAVDCLASGGRIAVITFHSLEDRIVKNIFRKLENPCVCPSDFPICICNQKPKLKILTKKPLVPEEKEIIKNPRARSAKLRVAEKL